MRYLIPLISLWFLFVSCDNEQEPLPSYIEGLVELHADPNGVLRTLITEEGRSYGLINPQSGYTPGTVYRAYTIYTLSSSGAALYQLGIVPAEPATEKSPDQVRQDPVELVSIWKTQSRWLNAHVRIPAGEGTVDLGWIWSNIEERVNEQGPYKMLHFTLETKIQQTPYMYKEYYISSCPLTPFLNQMRRGIDSISVTLNTESGIVERRFVY